MSEFIDYVFQRSTSLNKIDNSLYSKYNVNVRERYMETSAVPTPSSSDTAVQMRNETSVNSLSKIELSTESILL